MSDPDENGDSEHAGEDEPEGWRDYVLWAVLTVVVVGLTAGFAIGWDYLRGL